MLTKNLCVRITDYDDQALAELTVRLGEKKRTQVVRKLIRERVGLGPYLMPAELAVVKESVRVVNALGINLNQIARAVNSGQIRAASPEMVGTLGEIRKIINGLKAEWHALILRANNRA